jgi:hypothetical protein
LRVPAALEQIRRVLEIPVKKTESRLVKHLTGQVPALVEHFFDIDVTKFQR